MDMYWAIPFNKCTPLWMIFHVCPRGYSHIRISPYSLVNFSEFAIILRKLLFVLGMSRQNFLSQGRQIALSSMGGGGGGGGGWVPLLNGISHCRPHGSADFHGHQRVNILGGARQLLGIQACGLAPANLSTVSRLRPQLEIGDIPHDVHGCRSVQERL